MKNKFLLSIILSVLLISCSGKNDSPEKKFQMTLESQIQNYPAPNLGASVGYPTPEIEKLHENVTVGKPDEGFSAIKGKINLRSGQILKNTTIYLTPGKGDNNELPPKILIGPEDSNGDYASHTNQDGEFAINNLKPGSYFLVASSSNNWWIVEDKEQKPLQIVLVPNIILDIGEVAVYLP